MSAAARHRRDQSPIGDEYNRGVHTRYIAGYKVWAMEVGSRQRGRVPIIWQQEAGWKVYRTTSYGYNVVSFIITVGWKQWFFVVTYVNPNKQPTVHWV